MSCLRLASSQLRKKAIVPGLAPANIRPCRWGCACAPGRADGRVNRTELLVDADTWSLAEIKQAIQSFEQDGQRVRTSIYAAPARRESTTWRSFMQMPSVNFCPVHRCKGEANDAALVSKVAELARSKQQGHIALMVQDKGFLPAVREAAQRVKIVVVVPSRKFNVVRRYEEAGIQVLTLEPIRDSSPRVRAVLHADGTGSVHLGDPYVSYDSSKQVELVRSFLQDLGYDGGGYLLHAAAKFWLRNKLGSLMVFPQQCATRALHEMLEKRGQNWKRHEASSALVIPKTSAGSITLANSQLYGSVLARRIFQGGGPFMLPDSSDLVRFILQQLGFLDNDMNKDMAEAMLIFANMSDNKHCLRKLGVTPLPAETPREVEDKLRTAFLSPQTLALWQKAPLDSRVRQVLMQSGLLQKPDAPRVQVLVAMQSYARNAKLPPAKTYNGNVWRILSHLTAKDASRTAAVSFKV